jgi:hypothetical protein
LRSAGGERAEESVGDEHAEERTDQRAADQVAQHLGRLGDRAHGLDHAQHGGDDAERWRAVGQRLHGVDQPLLLLMVRFELLVHQRFHLVRHAGAQRHHAEVIAHELDGVVVGGEGGEALEQRGFVWVLDVLLEGENALRLHQLEDGELQAEQLDIGGLVVARALEQGAEHAERLLQHRAGIADDVGAGRGAQNDQGLERLDQHFEVAAHHDVAADHAAEDHYDADDKAHKTGPALPNQGQGPANLRQSIGAVRSHCHPCSKRLLSASRSPPEVARKTQSSRCNTARAGSQFPMPRLRFG